MIRGLERSEEIRRVRLLVCNAGVGDNSPAQQLADVLGPEYIVEAAADYVFITTDGEVIIAPPIQIDPNIPVSLENARPDMTRVGEFQEFRTR